MALKLGLRLCLHLTVGLTIWAGNGTETYQCNGVGSQSELVVGPNPRFSEVRIMAIPNGLSRLLLATRARIEIKPSRAGSGAETWHSRSDYS
jgi:hypothetical protein